MVCVFWVAATVKWLKDRDASALKAAAALTGVAIYVWALQSGGPAQVVAFCGTCLVVGVFFIAAAVIWLKHVDAAGQARLERELAAGFVLAFLLVAAVTIAQAALDAHAVREGRSAQPTGLGLRFASWGAERATLRWVGNVDTTARRALEAPCLMYLGTSNGTAFLYMPGTGETLRVPASEVAIATKDVTVPCGRR